MAELARRQHGVLSYGQLRELGFSKGHIARAEGAGRLQRVHRGVYAVGTPRSPITGERQRRFWSFPKPRY